MWRFCLAAIFAAAAAAPNGLGRKPPMGWTTWCTSASCYQKNEAGALGGYHDFCDEAMVLSVAKALLVSGMQDVGYTRVNLDDCWAWTERDAQGNLMADPTRFPHGIPWLVSQLAGMGLELGLYTSAGPTTCSSGGRNGSIPGSYGHYPQDVRCCSACMDPAPATCSHRACVHADMAMFVLLQAAQFVSWGVTWMTLDFCDWHFNWTVLTPWGVAQDMYTALNGTGHPVWLSFHCLPYDLGLPSDWCGEYGNSFTIWEDHHDNWASTMSELVFLAQHPSYVGPSAWNDPDFLMTGECPTPHAPVVLCAPLCS